jgi:hypothetical protein
MLQAVGVFRYRLPRVAGDGHSLLVAPRYASSATENQINTAAPIATRTSRAISLRNREMAIETRQVVFQFA